MFIRALTGGLLLACSLYLLGCGGSHQPGLLTNSTPSSKPQTQELPLRQVALDAALVELEGMATPAGVESTIFAELKAELARVLKDYYGSTRTHQAASKQASGIGVEDLCQAWCAEGQCLANGTVTISWRGRHLGDYDLNGEVNISDLTPLGIHFGRTTDLDADGLPVVAAANEWASQADGDGNGELNIADISPIGLNFSSVHQGYRLYTGTSDDGETYNWSAEFLAPPDDPGLPVSIPFNTSTKAGEIQRYTFSFPMPALEAGQRAYIKLVPFDGVTEGLEQLLPLHDGPHALFKCGMCHCLTNRDFRGVESTCYGCHAAPPENHLAAWTDVPTLHRTCMICHDEHSFAVSTADPPCATCHSSIVEDATEAGMPACLDCHMTAHIPVGQPTEEGCRGCHLYPDGDDSLSWETAPGQHATCFACHGSHGFALDPPTAVCAECHGALIDGGHSGGSIACLGCHNSPHVPEASATGMDCYSCHPTPPENLSAAWTDAPGSHGQCFHCHLGETHGTKPEPPESICNKCHAEVISGSHSGYSASCLECHTYPHLPELEISGLDCQQCHPTPPEDSAASWDDAPGQHALCSSCHLGTEHGVSPVPPESICSECHSALISGGHAGGVSTCLNCHTFPHLPETNIAGMDCTQCHLTPPENSAASWADAPDQHAQCELCHSEEVHGDKPVPAVSVCGDCHGILISDGHAGGNGACLDCHAYVHIPEINVSGVDCTVCHLTPPENTDASWSDAPGQHNQCSLCHVSTEHGVSPVPPESVCAACHGTLLDAGHAGGITTCLDCHNFAHLPEIDITGMDCTVCHLTPPEDAAASWDDAPGQHSQCGLCHVGAEHGDKPVPPESICAACHSSLLDAGHAGGISTCLDCHSFAHLPELDVTGVDCTICHLTPPEDAGASWADAPGQHADCSLCHPGAEHGVKPVPPESICVDCHGTLLDAGHAGGISTCLDCHNFAHLPDTSYTGIDCTLCHLTPPEDTSASWDDAPGQHADCALCHLGDVHGTMPVPPESICSDCHSTLIDAGHAGGITTCLDCHTFAHLPETIITGVDCTICHLTPPEDTSASWADAPGQHADCAQCHLGPEHGEKPVPPEAVCADCHGTLIDGGHAGGIATCLSCHYYAHLPQEFDLHDLHWPPTANCFDCHSGGGGVGTPDRDDCLACHTDKTEHYPAILCQTCHYMTK